MKNDLPYLNLGGGHPASEGRARNLCPGQIRAKVAAKCRIHGRENQAAGPPRQTKSQQSIPAMPDARHQ